MVHERDREMPESGPRVGVHTSSAWSIAASAAGISASILRPCSEAMFSGSTTDIGAAPLYALLALAILLGRGWQELNLVPALARRSEG